MNDSPDANDLIAQSQFPAESETTEKLRARLVANAQRLGLLDVSYRYLDTPVGPLLLAATEKGLARIAFECEGFDDVVESLASTLSPRILEAPARLDTVATALEEYFAGARRSFDFPLDHALSAGFRQIVQQYLPHIAYGHTLSYKEVAESVGNPKAVRAVGTACATNPLPIVLPCHRVLRSDGSLGGYVGGMEAKTTLLKLEQAS